MASSRLSLDRVVVGQSTPRGWTGGLGAAAQVQRVLRAQESSDDDDEVFVKQVRSARGGRVSQARHTASARATAYVGGASGGDAANYSAPGASAAEIQRRRKIMFDSDDDDDDTPIYMRGSNRVRTSPKGRKSQAARTKLNKLARLWGRDEDESRRSISPSRGGRAGSKSPSATSSDHEYLKPALHHEPQDGMYVEENSRKDHVRFSVEGTRVESPVMFVPTHAEDTLPNDEERTVGFADEQVPPAAVPISHSTSPRMNSYPAEEESGSDSDDLEAISGRQQRNKASSMKQTAPEPIIHNAQPPIGPPSELPASVARLASGSGLFSHERKTRLGSWHGPDTDAVPLLRTTSGQELHPRKLSVPQLEALGIQSSILSLPDSDPQEMAKEIRSLRYEIVQLQRIHRAQVQHLEESAAKTETDLAEMRGLLSEMASLLAERGLVPETVVTQAENLGRGDEDNTSSTKVAISAEFVLDDGLRSQTMSTGGGSDRGSDRLASEMKLASKGHHVHMADEIQVKGMGGCEVHQPPSSQDSSKPLVSILASGKSPRGSPHSRPRSSPFAKSMDSAGAPAPLPVVELTPRAVEASSDKPPPAEKTLSGSAPAEKKHSLMDTYLDQQSRIVSHDRLTQDKAALPNLGHAPTAKKPVELGGSPYPADRPWKPIDSPRNEGTKGAVAHHESGAFSTPAPTRKNSVPEKADAALPPVPPAAAEPPPQPTIATPVAKTPQQRVKVMKAVTVQRIPIPGTQQVPGAKIGIGISFGVTAKGEVFITGMAPNGPARGSGQIRRGDQLISVDGVNVKGWDVQDIVKLIVGDVGRSVKLVVFGLSVEDTMASPATNTPGA